MIDIKKLDGLYQQHLADHIPDTTKMMSTGKDSLQVEAMKQSLEALEDVQEMMNTSQWFNDRVTALRQAIEKAEKSELLGNSEQLGKEWVGLTVEDKTAIRNSVEYSQFMSAEEYASLVQDATEAKLKEKNA